MPKTAQQAEARGKAFPLRSLVIHYYHFLCISHLKLWSAEQGNFTM